MRGVLSTFRFSVSGWIPHRLLLYGRTGPVQKYPTVVFMYMCGYVYECVFILVCMCVGVCVYTCGKLGCGSPLMSFFFLPFYFKVSFYRSL